jgi:3-oxoacyl-[acyl-carrier-protein] synthase-3
LETVRTVIKGVGGYLPQRVVTNDDLAKIVDTSDSWITERTGIKERPDCRRWRAHLLHGRSRCPRRPRRCRHGARRTSISSSSPPSTPDQTFPATAVTIQAELGITQGAAFDMQAVCSGFVFALATADSH